jgi:ubiquinone/menaquinone biosynthesis C-methylase UbiE
MQAWPDAGAGLREIRRVLKSGGNLALGFTIYSGQSRDEVTQSLAGAGLTNARLVEGENIFCAIVSSP